MQKFIRAVFVLVAILFAAGFALAQGGAGEVVSLTLFNADTDQPIGELTDGMTLDFSALGTRNLSVVAMTNPATVGSVRFALDDREDYQTESNAPYAIAGDQPGPDYNPWTPTVGEHTLTVTPYSESGGNGEAGTALTVRFNVVNASESAATECAATEDSATEDNATAEQPEPAPTPPATPEPATPEPATPEPATPEPATPEVAPTETAPAETTPAETAPAETAPAEPATETQSATAQIEPAPVTVTPQVSRTRYQVLPVDGSGVRGSVLVSDYGFDGAIVVILLSGTPVDGVHPAHFHAGDCGSGGDIVVPLENVNGRSGLSVTTTDTPYDDVVNGNYYLNIHLSPDNMGTIVACGEVGANAQ